ncbi:class II glutamine amidotransferase [Naumannella halotolerans]|uniref:class II glutamine amidotransferase n=1 Tax=Naumannella halotolerans TaxID=993414 RepID=UPI00370D6546
MCRLLAMTAGESRTMSEHLGEDLDRFVALSERHRDGWGLASSSGGAPELVKAPEQALGSPRFAEAATQRPAEQFLLHLRLASPNKLHSMQNTHPFVSTEVPGGHPDLAFAHNGHVFDNASLNARTGQVTARRPLGQTDSEAYFFIVDEFLRRGEEPLRALAAAMQVVADSTEYTGLNAVLSMPEGLYAIHAADPNPRQGDLDRAPDPQQFELRYRVEERLSVVASNDWQPATDGWQVLANRQLLFLPAGGGSSMTVDVDEALLPMAA